MRLTLTHKVVIAIAIPVICQIGLLSLLLRSVESLDNLERQERATSRVLECKKQICTAEALVFLYYALYRASQKPEYKKALLQTQELQRTGFNNLRVLWKGDKVKLQILHDQWMAGMQQRIAFRLTADMPRAERLRDFFGGDITGREGIFFNTDRGNLGRLFEELERSQSRLLRESQERETAIKQSILAILFASILISVGAGLLFSRSIAVRLKKIVDNIHAMETEDVVLAPVGGHDEIAALNDAIIDTNRKIKEAEQFQAQTARIVAQELEQPLNQINHYLETLKNSGFDELNANGEERIERSLLEVTRLRALVKDLISLDKISRIGWELEFVQVNLKDIAKTAVDTVQDYANQSGVELISRLDDVLIIGDPSRLQQIALNLLTNAIKFSKRKAKVEVETISENNFGKLSVVDHGTGIPEEFQQKIFGHFEQASHSDGAEKGGSGPGLAISKRLVESQQGRMGFKSQLGEGSTFWFSLPLAELSPNHVSKLEKQQVGLQRLSIKPDKSMDTAHVTDDSTSKTNSSSKNVSSKRYRSTLWRNSLVIVLLPLIVQVITIVGLWNVISSIRGNVNEIHRFSQITSLHSNLLDALIRADVYAIMYNVSPSNVTTTYTERSRYLVRRIVDQLRVICASDAVLARDVESLDKMVQEHIQIQEEFIKAPYDSGVEQFFGHNSLADTERKMAQLVIPIEQAAKQEKKLVEQNVWAKTDMRQIVGNIILASALFAILLSIGYGIYTIRGLTTRVRRIVDNTKRLEAREPLLPTSGKEDEIGFVEQSFSDAATKLTKLEHYKQELIALTSHEFRTPLTSLLAKADLMQAGVFGPLNADGQIVVVKLKRSISDLIALLTNLLDVEKVQSGKSLVVKKDVQLSEILNKALMNVSDSVEEKQIDLKLPQAEVSINADATRLVQSLTAVLNDIMQHASARSTISLESKTVNNWLNLTINAPGGECSKEALNTASARGRLASDLLRLMVQQHGGRTSIEPSDERLVVQIVLPCGV